MPFSVSSIRNKEITFCNVVKLFGLGQEQYSTELPIMPVKAILETSLIKRAGFVE